MREFVSHVLSKIFDVFLSDSLTGREGSINAISHERGYGQQEGDESCSSSGCNGQAANGVLFVPSFLVLDHVGDGDSSLSSSIEVLSSLFDVVSGDVEFLDGR